MTKGTPSVKYCFTWFSTTIEWVVFLQPDTVLLNVCEAYLIVSYLTSLFLLKHKFTTSCSTPRRQGLWQLMLYVEIHFRFRPPFWIKKYLLCLCMNLKTRCQTTTMHSTFLLTLQNHQQTPTKPKSC